MVGVPGKLAEYFLNFLISLGAHNKARSLEAGLWLARCLCSFFKNVGLLTTILKFSFCSWRETTFLIETFKLWSWSMLDLMRCWWSKYFKLWGTFIPFLLTKHLTMSRASLKLGLCKCGITFCFRWHLRLLLKIYDTRVRSFPSLVLQLHRLFIEEKSWIFIHIPIFPKND